LHTHNSALVLIAPN